MSVRERKGGQAGFTLLEVILSLALFTAAVGAFATAYVNVLNALHAVRVDQAFEQDMALIRRQALTLESVEDLEAGGEVVTGSHGYATWSAEYAYTGVADLFEVTLFVELWPADADESMEVEETFHLTRPSWSDPLEREALRAETRERHLERQLNRDDL